jgi:hypothetical protein
MKDPKAWLRPGAPSHGGDVKGSQPSSGSTAAAARKKAQTATMQRPLIFQNTLMAVAFRQQPSGFKDPGDAANRSNKHNGGDFLAFQSWAPCAPPARLLGACVAVASPGPRSLRRFRRLLRWCRRGVGTPASVPA